MTYLKLPKVIPHFENRNLKKLNIKISARILAIILRDRTDIAVRVVSAIAEENKHLGL